MIGLFSKPPWFQLIPAGLYRIPTAAPLLHYLAFVSRPFPSCLIPCSEILLSYSYGKQKGNGLSSVAASELSRGIDPACQGVKISGFLLSPVSRGRTASCFKSDGGMG